MCLPCGSTDTCNFPLPSHLPLYPGDKASGAVILSAPHPIPNASPHLSHHLFYHSPSIPAAATNPCRILYACLQILCGRGLVPRHHSCPGLLPVAQSSRELQNPLQDRTQRLTMSFILRVLTEEQSIVITSVSLYSLLMIK